VSYISRLIKSTSSEPAIATTKEVRLNPVTPTPKNICPKNPPTTAPMTPKMIDPIMPPFELGTMKLAMLPAISPKTIQ
jgi:hypothetical protein